MLEFEILLGLVIAVAIVICAMVFLKLRVRFVDEEERLIIYRFGEFERIAGPGPVLLWMRIDKIQRTIKIRNEPHDFVVNNLFAYDIPFGYKLNFWSCFDPATFLRQDPKRFAELAQFEDHERLQHMRVKVRDALVNSIVKVQSEQNKSPNSPLEKILLIAPGLEGYNRIMSYVGQELVETLPKIGFSLDREHPITITELYLSPDIVGIFNRDRITEQIRKNFPDIAQIDLVKITSAFEGVDVPTITTHVGNQSTSHTGQQEVDFLTKSLGENQVAPEARFTSDGRVDMRGKIRPQQTEHTQEDPVVKEPVVEDAVQDQAAQPDNYKLTPADLAVLKRVA